MSDRTSSEGAAERWLGQTLGGRYRIEAPLGAGGLGMVYRATHVGLDRPVAIKVLHPDLLPSTGLRQRFEREVKTLSRLAHPHIVTLTDSGVLDDGTGYLVMELLEGESLEQRMRAGALPPDLAIGFARQILLGLAEAHGKGVLHRDIKPANIFLTPLADGGSHVKLLDFGLAKVRNDLVTDPGAFPTLTADGTIVGTPTYMAPEQAAAASADATSDVYSVGIVLFEMLAGRPPFEGANKLETIRLHLGSPVPELDEVCKSLTPTPELRALVHKALSKERLERYASAREMLAALDALPTPAARVSATAATERPPPIRGTEPTVSVRSSELQTVDSLPASSRASAKRARSKPSSSKRSWIAAAVALVLVGITTWALWPSDDAEPTATGSNGSPEVRTSPTDEGASDAGTTEVAEGEQNGTEEDSETDPQNPFNASPIPDELRESRHQIFRGRFLSDDQINAVRRYQRAHPDDPRPALLLARHYRLKGEWRAAVRQYRAAQRIDPRVTGFRPMLTDLVRAATERSSATAAAQAIEQIYGRGALPELDRVLGRRGLDANDRRRLARLRARCAALPEG